MMEIALFTLSGAAVIGLAMFLVGMVLIVPLAIIKQNKSLFAAAVMIVTILATCYFIGKHLWTAEQITTFVTSR